MWLAMNNVLFVDDKIRRVGINLASKCECCGNGAYEDLNHALVFGQVAQDLWTRLLALMGIPFVPSRGWKERVLIWFRKAERSSYRGTLFGLILCILC